MSFSDAIGRISQIQQQLVDLTAGTATPTSATTPSTSAGAGTETGVAATASTSTATSDFVNALTQAQSSDPTLAGSLSSALASASTPSSTSSVSGASALSTATPLPASATQRLTSDQQQFASTLAGATGLNPGVVTAWLLAEENGSAAQSRQAADNNDWLNVGYTDSATYGGSDSVWSDPVSAATATAQWLKGQDAIPGYGTASSGVQAILSTVGQSPQAQISALQNSGWASGGYPELGALYAQVVGG